MAKQDKKGKPQPGRRLPKSEEEIRQEYEKKLSEARARKKAATKKAQELKRENEKKARERERIKAAGFRPDTRAEIEQYIRGLQPRDELGRIHGSVKLPAPEVPAMSDTVEKVLAKSRVNAESKRISKQRTAARKTGLSEEEINRLYPLPSGQQKEEATKAAMSEVRTPQEVIDELKASDPTHRPVLQQEKRDMPAIRRREREKMMARRQITYDSLESALAKGPKENEKQHAAILLYACMNPNKRSRRKVAALLLLSKSAVDRWEDGAVVGVPPWGNRIAVVDAHGEIGHRYAVEEFRSKYGALFGHIMIVDIHQEDMLGCPLPDDLKDFREAKHDQAQDLQRQLARKTLQEANRNNEERRQMRENLLALSRGVLSALGKRLLNDKVPVKPSDMRVILDLEARMQSVLSEESDKLTDAITVDPFAGSARIKRVIARHPDDDMALLAALEEDVQEIIVVINTLREHHIHSNIKLDAQLPPSFEEKAQPKKRLTGKALRMSKRLPALRVVG